MTSRAERYSSLWIMLPLGFGVLSATITILGLAWLNVWLQFFGERADRGDYAVAAGTTAGGIGFLALAALTVWLARGPRWLHVACWAITAVMVMATIACLGSANDTSLDPADSYDTFGGGVQTVVSMPWNWLIVAAFLGALAVRFGFRRDSVGGGRPGS